MTNHADLIAALRIPMDVTLPGAPELDEYDEQRKAAADALEACAEVKPLVWSWDGCPNAETPFCVYCVVEVGDSRWKWSRSEYPYHYESDPVHLTEDSAKEAAQADYERRVLASVKAIPASEVWTEATAAAYGAAHDIAKSWFHNVGKGTPYAEIEAITPQSARDWLTTHDAKAYRRGQEDMRERAAEVLRDKWASTTAEHEEAIRAIPIKEKDDE